MTLTHNGEQWLDDWIEDNAHVCWLQHTSPWEFEDKLLSNLSLPLNIKGNREHPFTKVLTDSRKKAIRNARELPVASELNQRRMSTK